MSYNKPIKRIAIVGTGVIGASWAAEYLARGFDVVATDPAPNAEANLRKYVDEAWNDLTKIGLSKGASKNRLTFTIHRGNSDGNLSGNDRPDCLVTHAGRVPHRHGSEGLKQTRMACNLI
jgi:3-hydroxyacyl-CoA dehydrogenase